MGLLLIQHAVDAPAPASARQDLTRAGAGAGVRRALPVITPRPSAADILWRADEEAGTFAQWTGACSDCDGGIYNTGTGSATIVPGPAHSGIHAAALTITTDGANNQAVRLFRWRESRRQAMGTGLYYSAWFYFPQRFDVLAPLGGFAFWNIFQWKSRRRPYDPTSSVEPNQDLTINNRADGSMYFSLWSSMLNRNLGNSALNIPVGRWWQLEVYVVKALDTTGRITVWQDGVQVIAAQNVPTTYSEDFQWSVDSYSRSLNPRPTTIYVDDAAIATARLGP
jgi:hypothetical protein